MYPKQKQNTMDDALFQALDSCRLARELECSIRHSTAPIHPHYLLNSCKEIVAAFLRVMDGLHSLNRASHSGPLMLLAEASTARMDNSAIDPLRTMVVEDDNQLFPVVGSSSASQAIDSLEFSGAWTWTFANTPCNWDAEAFGGDGGGEAPLAAARSSSGRGFARPNLAQRSSRKRKEGAMTMLVPAAGARNMNFPPDDGYTWRKYGQKDILNSAFPRSYYRCTHKSYYGCTATKQVQRLDDDPNTLEVTYCGVHTCNTSPIPILTLVPGTVGAGTEDSTIGGGNPEPGAAPPPAMQETLQLLAEARLQLKGERDADVSVAELADAMFNSGSSSSGMDGENLLDRIAV